MIILKDLTTYLSLSQEEKTTTYLDEQTAHNIPTIPSNDPLIDIRTLPGGDALYFDPSIPNYFVRKTLGEKLIAADQKARGFQCALYIYELYRDSTLQREQFNATYIAYKQERPEATHEELWELTTQFNADPDLTPPHCTGGAVDLTLLDLTNNTQLDIGSPINTISEQAAHGATGLSPEATINRAQLLNLLLEEGLAPLATEWWHYSYGEKYWAAFYNTHALYETTTISS